MRIKMSGGYEDKDEWKMRIKMSGGYEDKDEWRT